MGAREIGFELRTVAVWPQEDPEADQHLAWVREGWERLSAYGNGRQYPTFLADGGLAGARSAYEESWERLVALKDRYDPTNLFRLNANIPPSASPALGQVKSK